MTGARFDAIDGRLQLDQAAFDELVDVARGDAGRLHPAVASALLPVTEPVCLLRLALTDVEGGLKTADGWLRPDGTTLLLDLPESGLRDLVTVPTDMVPAAIARIVRLGPRPRPEPEPLAVGSESLAGLLAADADERRRAGRGLAAALPGPWRAWRAQMTWFDPRVGPAGRAIQVVDAEPGLYLAASDGEEGTLWPTTPTAVWRLLVTLLPRSDELG